EPGGARHDGATRANCDAEIARRALARIQGLACAGILDVPRAAVRHRHDRGPDSHACVDAVAADPRERRVAAEERRGPTRPTTAARCRQVDGTRPAGRVAGVDRWAADRVELVRAEGRVLVPAQAVVLRLDAG